MNRTVCSLAGVLKKEGAKAETGHLPPSSGKTYQPTATFT